MRSEPTMTDTATTEFPTLTLGSAVNQARTPAARHHHTEKPRRKKPMSEIHAPTFPPQLRTDPSTPEVDQAGSWFEWLNKANAQKTKTTRPRTRPTSWANREAPAGCGVAVRRSGVVRVCKEYVIGEAWPQAYCSRDGFNSAKPGCP